MGKFHKLIQIADWVTKTLVGFYLTLGIFTNLGLALDYKYATATAPYFDLLIILFVMPLAAIHYKEWLPFMKTDYFKWCVLLTAVYLFNYLRMTLGGYPASLIDLIDETNRLQRVILWPVIGFIVYTVDFRFFKTGFFIALITMPFLVLVDFLDPFVLGPSDEIMDARAQGTYLNANIAAEAVLLLGLLNIRRFKGTLGIVLFFTIGIGVILTFSRSGLVGLILLYGYMFFRGHMPKISILAPVLLIFSFSTLLIYAEDVLLTLGYDSSVANVMSRLSFLDTAVDSEQTLEDGSSESREQVAKDAFADVLSRPISGHVFDAEEKYGMNPHNEPIFLWYTFGITGIFAWFCMIAMLIRAGLRSGIGWLNPAPAVFIWFSMFSHNLLDFRYWIIAIAFFTLTEANKWHKVTSVKSLGKHESRRKTKVQSTNVLSSGKPPSRRSRRKAFRF